MAKGKKKPQKKRTPKIPTKKIKVLAYCDSPTCATGFGTVSRNIFEGLYNTGRYDIEVLGINYWGDPHNFPYRIWPTGTNPQKDPYGRQKVLNMIPQMDFDILFFLQDSFILNFLPKLMPHLKQHKPGHRSICYYPVDSVIKKDWGENVNHVDYLVSYSEFGVEETRKAIDREEILVIPHGVNTKEYFPVSEAEAKSFRHQYFGSKADKFIITNVNRNQQRKDIPRFLLAFKKFRETVPDSIAYCHMAQNDQGWDLPQVCDRLGFSISSDVIFPKNFGPNQGYPREIVNLIYNASDVVTSTTLGEGFGLAWIEAMAAKVPTIMPDNTAMSEFITEDRGYLVKSGTNTSLYTVVPHDNEVIRPLTDLDDLSDTLIHVYNNRDEAKQKAVNAYKWAVEEMDWQRGIVPHWVGLFDKAYEDIQKGEQGGQDATDIIGNLGSDVVKNDVIKTEEI